MLPNTFLKKVFIRNLKPGMMPAEIIVKHKRKYIKQRIGFFSEKNAGYLFSVKSAGLSQKDILKIKKVKKNG